MEKGPKDVLQGLLDASGIAYKDVVQTEAAGQTVFSIQTDDSRPLIGVRGDTIHALDVLVKKIMEKRVPQSADGAESKEPLAASDVEWRFLVDVNDYRVKQIKDLQTKALMLAERARSFQYDVELNPMSAYERLIIHTTLQDAPNVKTESQGEGRNRRVVIKYTA